MTLDPCLHCFCSIPSPPLLFFLFSRLFQQRPLKYTVLRYDSKLRRRRRFKTQLAVSWPRSRVWTGSKATCCVFWQHRCPTTRFRYRICLLILLCSFVNLGVFEANELSLCFVARQRNHPPEHRPRIRLWALLWLVGSFEQTWVCMECHSPLLGWQAISRTMRQPLAESSRSSASCSDICVNGFVVR